MPLAIIIKHLQWIKNHEQYYCVLGLKRYVNLLSGYPDANISGYPMDNDIIKLVLLAIYFKLITTSLTKYNIYL